MPKSFVVAGLLSFTLLCFSVGNLGCKKESPVEPNLPPLPALTDSIPFDILGQGKLVFARIGPHNNNYSGLYVVDIDHRRSWGIGGGVLDGPAVSPDGQSIAYSASNGGSTVYDVYIMNIDGSGARQVTSMMAQEFSPSWTVDSRQILFHATPFDFADGICLVYRQSPSLNPPDRILIRDFGQIDPPYVYQV
jgi:hypothetical protein